MSKRSEGFLVMMDGKQHGCLRCLEYLCNCNCETPVWTLDGVTPSGPPPITLDELDHYVGQGQIGDDRLAALEELYEAAREWQRDGSHSSDSRLCEFIDAISPKPEVPVEIEGMTAEQFHVSRGWYCRWHARNNASVIVGPVHPTEQEAIRAGNEFIRKVRGEK